MGLSFRRPGDEVPLPGAKPGDRGPREDRLIAFGMSVTLADDLRNPAYGTQVRSVVVGRRTKVETLEASRVSSSHPCRART